MVRALQNNYIDGQVLTGVSVAKRIFVSRVPLTQSDSNLPFTLKRRQFTVRLAYSMTINKSQGQTFDKVGVYLKNLCFSHGKLYVACSRTRSFNSLFFKVDKHYLQGMSFNKCYTNNVVFTNVVNLQDCCYTTKQHIFCKNLLWKPSCCCWKPSCCYWKRSCCWKLCWFFWH